MTSHSWNQVKSLFERLRSMPSSRRHAALAEASIGDTGRAEAGDLLACAEAMGGFLDEPWSTPEPWPDGHRVSGRYRIIRRIGRGGMGDVYEAEDTELRIRVALKTIRPDHDAARGAPERVRREVELARRIAHPNVCRIFDIGRDARDCGAGDTLFISMELLAGETLDARIARAGPLRDPEASAIAAQMCAGLDAAHDAGVIHRDLKAGNVMLVPAPGGVRVVITDFGLAVPGESRQRQGEVCGTPHYMAPEQVAGAPVGPAADIFALGVLLYRLISGRYPYEGANAWHVMIRRLTDAPVLLRIVCPGVQPRWEQAIARCLAREPRARPAHARDVIALIDGRRTDGGPRRRVLVMAAIIALAARPDGRAPINVTTAPLPATKHVAVLPFTLADAERSPALADGISESVSAQLDDLRRLDPRLSSVPFADVRAAGANGPAAARRLFGVNLAVTGDVRATGSRLSVTLRLIDASTGRPLRQEDATLGGDAATLARPLLALLDMPPDPGLRRLDTGAVTAIAPSAYEFYEQGKGYLLRSGERDADAAIALLRRAVDAQPTFALAQAALARAYAKRYQRTRDAEAADRAQAAAADALRLDPSLASAHAARGMVLRQTQRRDEAVQAFEAALQRDPDDADVLNQLANTYDELGDPLRAEAMFQRAIRANPGYWVGYNNLGRFYLQHRQFDRARQQFTWATELAPDNPRAHSNLGGLYLALGEYANATVTLQHAYDLQPTAAICSNLGTASLALGGTARAIAMFEQAVTLAPRDHRYRRNLGDAYDVAGRHDDARTAWEKAAAMAEADATRGAAASADQWASAALYRAKLRDAGAARRWLTAAARVLRPDDAGALLKMAQAQELAGDRRAALDTLTRATGAGLARSEIEQSAELARLRRDARYVARAAPAPAP